MRVTSLKLANVRAIKAAEFQFRSGINLVVGVNGVGKSSVLDSLRVCLSAFVKEANRLRSSLEPFVSADIRVGADAMTVECGGLIGSAEYQYVIHMPRTAIVPQKGKEGMPREEVHDTRRWDDFLGKVPKPATGAESGGRPIAVLFSTERAIPSRRAPGRTVAAGGTKGAFAGAFTNRELEIGEIEHWMRAQEALRPNHVAARKALAAFEGAVVRFLPGYAHLRPDGGSRRRLLIDRAGSTVSVQRMSDGERGVLALVLDLTRRLVQANPELKDPVAEAEAVVLIDELDLHLHPKWQRQICLNLTKTFPRCQFIATSHSPQVVASVDPEQVHLLTPDGVVRPDRTRGMDTNWILRHLMEADDRPMDAKAVLESVERSVAEGAFDDARAEMSAAKQRGFDLPEWSILEARIARLEILAE